VLLTLTTTHEPATDLGFLLHKHPDRVQSFEVTAGQAHVFYPEATEQTCTAALMVEIDPIALVRGRGRKDEGFVLGQYVNDRPYAASSFLAVALSRVFKTAMSGRCDKRPELVDALLPLVIRIPALPCRGGAALATRLFQPLGWQVDAVEVPLDETFPQWGASRYVDLTLTGDLRLADALTHLYVLMPVLDDAKHYWVSPDEVDKLVRAGGGWLANHPDKALISRRYLAYRGSYVRSAMSRLAEVDDTEPEEIDNAVEETPAERPVPLAQQRHGAVLAALRASGAQRVADLGCGEGTLVGELLSDVTFEELVATDVSVRALEIAARRLHLDTMPERKKARLRMFQSSLSYRDERLSNLDAAVLMEVIEHVDPPRLPALERVVFGEARPKSVLVTTPNSEYNVRYETLPAGSFRHRDHRFEWSRAEFVKWAGKVAGEWGYQVRYLPVGTDDPEVGSPTQLAIFTRAEVTE
jgi:3' terminal RNA ribose 2'-O-methyltransferase Hen1